MAEAKLTDAAAAEIEAGRAARERSMAEFGERTKGKPTPTQAECDEAAVQPGRFCGVEHEHDGSNPDPVAVSNKALEGKPSGSYQTRTAKPAASS